MDPLETNYPDLSSFCFAGNSVILFQDVDGKKFVNSYIDQVKQLKISLEDAEKALQKTKSENPGLKDRELKKTVEYQNLESVRLKLYEAEENAQEVEDYLYTLYITKMMNTKNLMV